MGTDDSHDSNLPEVVQRNEDPIAVPRDEEGMQAVPQQNWDQRAYYEPVKHDDHGSTPPDATAEKEVGRPGKSKKSRRTWIILGVILAVVIILAIGLGAGLGVGLNSRSAKGSNTNAQPQPQSQSQSSSRPGTRTSKTSTSSPATSTCSGVTSGQTGIACVSCNQTDSNTGGYVATAGSMTTTFDELCNIDMPNNSPVYDTATNAASKTRNVSDIEAVLSYSFTDCMNQCARYNQQYGTNSQKYPCKAVTYGANITAAIQEQGSSGNCYLKDARGYGIFDSSGFVSSGYIVDI